MTQQDRQPRTASAHPIAPIGVARQPTTSAPAWPGSRVPKPSTLSASGWLSSDATRRLAVGPGPCANRLHERATRPSCPKPSAADTRARERYRYRGAQNCGTSSTATKWSASESKDKPTERAHWPELLPDTSPVASSANARRPEAAPHRVLTRERGQRLVPRSPPSFKKPARARPRLPPDRSHASTGTPRQRSSRPAPPHARARMQSAIHPTSADPSGDGGASRESLRAE